MGRTPRRRSKSAHSSSSRPPISTRRHGSHRCIPLLISVKRWAGVSKCDRSIISTNLKNEQESTMRFMVIVKGNKDSEAGVLPDAKLLADMGKFNEELSRAGVLLAAEGLQASSKGARVKFSGDKRTVSDGPFPETKE